MKVCQLCNLFGGDVKQHELPLFIVGNRITSKYYTDTFRSLGQTIVKEKQNKSRTNTRQNKKNKKKHNMETNTQGQGRKAYLLAQI